MTVPTAETGEPRKSRNMTIHVMMIFSIANVLKCHSIHSHLHNSWGGVRLTTNIAMHVVHAIQLGSLASKRVMYALHAVHAMQLGSHA